MKWLWKSSTAKSLIGGFLTVLLPVIAVSIVINYISIHIVTNEVTGSYTNALLLLTRQLDNSLMKYESLVKALSVDTDLDAINESPKEEGIQWEYARLVKQLNFYSNTNELDGSIGIYLRSKDRIISSKYGLDKIGETNLDEITRYNGIWRFAKSLKSGEDVLSFSKASAYSQSPKSVVVTVDISISQIKSLLQNLQVQGGGTTFLMDTSGHIVLPAAETKMDMNKVMSGILASSDQTGQFNLDLNREPYRVIFNKENKSGLILGMYFLEESIMAPILRIRSWIVVIIFVALCVAVLFTLYTYRGILFPVQKMVESMSQVRNGNLKVRILENRKAEFGFMFEQFNHMVERIDCLINEVYTDKLKLQEAQLKFLQSQINPHFLYNCFNLIYQMAKSENTEGVAEMATYLGKYFRFVTKSNRNSITLSQELDNLEAYVNIQKMRFPGKIHYHVNICEGIEDIVLPRLILQPLIENSIIHGIESINRECNIWLKGESNGDAVWITVEDDGKGITEERLKEVNRALSESHTEDFGYGLSNIHWRLKLRYGEGAGLKIEQRQPSGTRSVLSIPRTKGELKSV